MRYGECGELGEWVAKVRKIGVKEFKLRDLPKDLQIRGITRKARMRGIIERVKDVGSYSVWRFVEHDDAKLSNA